MKTLSTLALAGMTYMVYCHPTFELIGAWIVLFALWLAIVSSRR